MTPLPLQLPKTLACSSDKQTGIQAMYSTQRVLVDEKLSLLISELPTRFSWVMDDKSNKYDLEATCDAAQLFLNVLNEKSNKHEAIQLGCCKVNVA
ncbi:hypothetical protein PSTT_02346 [Puccinia striiformis]|uniref:Uncharacterized protein n=1 Tax=Puccinia striiformis TaxID=27350 RepID=A0A2S4W082_9BASI|nr:hypothetical protein PSTT_02346 [Puccinia striiformis]